VASKYGDRVQLGRTLLEDTGSGLESPNALIDDTVLGELIKERMRYAQEYGDNPDLPNNTLDTELKNLYLGKGILDRIAPVEHLDIPEDPEADRIVDEAFLSSESRFTGGPRKKKPLKDKLDKSIEDTAKNEKRTAAKKKREDKIRDYVVDLLLKQGNELTPEQQALSKENADNPIAALTDIVNWDSRVDKDIRKDQIKRDKPLNNKDALARKLITYADNPEEFYKTWYKDNPVFAKRRLPDGKLESKEIIYDEDDNPDPDLEGVDLVRYADAMNEKFMHPNADGFIEYDYGMPTKTGDTAYPEDPLKAAATGKPFSEPEKLMFPEIANSEVEPKNNRLGMVRRMLFGELSDDELAYLMDLMGKDQQFAKGGYVDNKAFKYLQRVYGPNHPVLSDKRFKIRHVGKLATTIRRVV
jgi:hypothetical protein